MNWDARVSEALTDAFDTETKSAFLSAMFETASVAIVIADHEGRIVWCNDVICDVLARDHMDLLGRSIDCLGNGSLKLKLSEHQAHCLSNGDKPLSMPVQLGVNGDSKQVLLNSIPVTLSGKHRYDVYMIERVPESTVPENAESASLRDLVNKTSDGLLIVDESGQIQFCNASAAVILGRDKAVLTGSQFGFPIGDEEEFSRLELLRDGEPIFAEMRTVPTLWNGCPATLVSLHDITAREEVESLAAMQMKAIETAANGIFITHADGTLKWVNRAFQNMSGFSEAELIGQPISMIRSNKHDENFFKNMWRVISSGRVWQGRVVNRHRDGHLYTADQTITPIRDTAGRLSHFVAIQEDISERLRAQEELIHLAEYDTLTDLPNRHLFMDRLGSALERAARGHTSVAVLMMDLDNFKDINNALGHDVGDNLIVTVTKLIQDRVRTTDTVARLGGDEFAILLENLTDINAASRLVRSLLDCFKQSLDAGGYAVKTSASVGIAVHRQGAVDPHTLLRHAELAMYRAKADGRHSFRYFDQAMDDEVRKRVNLEADLRQALARNELWLAYQPQIDLKSGSVIGAEALLRWAHPEHGFVSPGDFIPIAESSGLILPIGDWIIEEICRQTKAWQEAGLPDVQVGINVSGHQFRQRDLGQQVLGELTKQRLSIESIDLEITETVAMERTPRVEDNVRYLTEAGISISMDDFGTGYSSLSNLQAFPVRRLKVDGSFVRGIGESRDDEKIVEAVVGLGHSLGLSVIAEGVETDGQIAFLRNLNCDEVQGYYYSKPLPAADFEQFLAESGRKKN